MTQFTVSSAHCVIFAEVHLLYSACCLLCSQSLMPIVPTASVASYVFRGSISSNMFIDIKNTYREQDKVLTQKC
jgi:hypothetical protein